jgi:Tfp pilus assembly protein PilN
MIRINLLPQRRARSRPTSAESAVRPLAAGVIGLAAAAAVVMLVVDRPKRGELAALAEGNRQLQRDIQSKTTQLAGYEALKTDTEAADERYKSIRRLLSAKVVPAHVLHELGEILTATKDPTMTADMTRRSGSDPNKRFQADWDASHVWLSGFTDTGGVFKLEGGAQSESDITQLAKRLDASVYFLDVVPTAAERVADNQSGTNYYKFTITGKVAY